MKGKICKAIFLLICFIAPSFNGALAWCQPNAHRPVARPNPSMPTVKKSVTGTITAIAHPRAGISVTIMGSDGITYQYGVEEGRIVGATAATLKVGDRVKVDFYSVTENYPPTYGNPVRTVVFPSQASTPGNSSASLTVSADRSSQSSPSPAGPAESSGAVWQNNQIGMNTFVSGRQGGVLLLLNTALFRNTDPSADAWSRIATNVKAMAVDAGSDQVIYALSVQNTVMKTMDQGGRWLTLDTGTRNQTLTSICVNPAIAQEVYVGGTNGLIKTDDSGFSWRATSFTRPVNQIVIDPAAPDVVYVLSGGAIYVSSDRGNAWKRSEAGLPTDRMTTGGRVASRTVAPVSLLVPMGQGKPALLAALNGKGVYRSLDNGATWTGSGVGIEASVAFVAASVGREQITLASQNSLFRSRNGKDWSQVKIQSDGNPLVGFLGVLDYPAKNGLLLDFRFPQDGEIENVGRQRRIGFLDSSGVLIGRNYGVLQHSEADLVWTTEVNGKRNLFAVTFNGADLDQVERWHRPTFLYLSKDNGYSWELLNQPVCGNAATRPVGAHSEAWIYGSSSCVLRTADGGQTWAQMPGFNFVYLGGAVTDLKFDPSRHNVVYYSTGVNERHLMRYQYNQDTKQGQAVDLKVLAAAVVVDQVNPASIFTDKAQLSTDGGWTWTDKSKALSTACKCDITSYYVGPAKPLSFRNGEIRMLIAYGKNAFNGYPGEIAVMQSPDAGGSWREISRLKAAGLRAGPFLDPDNSQDVFVGVVTATSDTAGALGPSFRPDTLKVLESRDGGMTWKEIYRRAVSGNDPGSGYLHGAAQFNSNGVRSILLATSEGILRSDDEGRTWTRLGALDGAE